MSSAVTAATACLHPPNQKPGLSRLTKRSRGILHQIIIRLLVNKTTHQIEDLRLEMPVAPGKDCLETTSSLETVRGLRITGGFTSKVKALVGNGDGSVSRAWICRLQRPQISRVHSRQASHACGYLQNMAFRRTSIEFAEENKGQ
jgi:hypothetical protein